MPAPRSLRGASPRLVRLSRTRSYTESGETRFPRENYEAPISAAFGAHRPSQANPLCQYRYAVNQYLTNFQSENQRARTLSGNAARQGDFGNGVDAVARRQNN